MLNAQVVCVTISQKTVEVFYFVRQVGISVCDSLNNDVTKCTIYRLGYPYLCGTLAISPSDPIIKERLQQPRLSVTCTC